MENLGPVVALNGLICIACGVFASRYAFKSYALVLAGTYLFQTLAIALMSAALMGFEVGTLTLVIPLVIAIAVWITAKLNFLWLWGSLTLVGLIIFAGIAYTILDSPADAISAGPIGAVYGLALIATIILRKHGRVLIVGISSGYNVGIGLVLLSMLAVPSSAYETLIMLSVLVILGAVAAGIYYQYKIDRRLLEGVATAS